MSRPKVFIGSSTEQLETARVLGKMLAPCAEAVVWDEYDFELGESIFVNLLKAADQFDFAVFLFKGDDKVTIRRSKLPVVRDNVVFELGLFIGKMGKDRALWLSPEGVAAPRTITDLKGIEHVTYPLPTTAKSSDLRRSLMAASKTICHQVERFGPKPDPTIGAPGDVRVLDHDVRVLCASSSDYPEEKFVDDIREIQQNFPPGAVETLRRVNADTLSTRLRNNTWDIVHLAVNVDVETGDLILPDPDPTKANPSKDRFLSSFFLERIEESRAQLVVIVTCDSLLLAARLARITNAIASIHQIPLQSAINWSKEFYWYLTHGRSLNEAFNRAQPLDPCPLLLTRNDFRLRSSMAKASQQTA